MKYYIENPQPFQIIKEFTIMSYLIKDILLNPGHSAVVHVDFYDEFSEVHNRSFLLIEGEYIAWENDQYLYDYINSHFMQIFDK